VNTAQSEADVIKYVGWLFCMLQQKMAAVTERRIIQSEVQVADFISLEEVESLATQAAPPQNRDLAKPQLATYAELRLRQGLRLGENMFCVSSFDAAPQLMGSL
jgi:hypothetical protein